MLVKLTLGFNSTYFSQIARFFFSQSMLYQQRSSVRNLRDPQSEKNLYFFKFNIFWRGTEVASTYATCIDITRKAIYCESTFNVFFF